MTTTSAPSLVTYGLTGSTSGPFATGWVYAEPEDVTAVLFVPGLPRAALVRNVDFTLTGVTPLISGGTVMLSGAVIPLNGWPDGSALLLRRRTVRRQSTALPDIEGHKPRATERAFDRQMRIAQEDADALARAIVAPFGEEIEELAPAAVRAGRFWSFDENGQPRFVEKPEDFDGLNKLNLAGDNVPDAATAKSLRDNIGVIELLSDAVGLRRLGFIGDGASHTLASVRPLWTLAAWQAVFPPSAITGSQGALSLGDEIDGLALQRAIDLQAPSGRIAITLPPCFAALSRPPVTNGFAPVSIQGAGGNLVSALVIQNPALDGWRHGQTLAGGPFQMRDVWLKGQSSGAALKVRSGSDFSVELIDCFFGGFSGGGLMGHNIRSSKTRGNVWSTLGGPTQRTADCYKLTQDQPCFQNTFHDKQILGYRTAYDWTNTSVPGYEGQYVEKVQINEGVSAFKVHNTLTYDVGGVAKRYYAPDWKFIDNEIEVSGQIASLQGMQGVDFRGHYVISLGVDVVPEGFTFDGVRNVRCRENSMRIIANGYGKLFQFANTTGFRFRDNDVLDQHNTTGVFLNFGAANADFVESGTTIDAAAGVTVAGLISGLSLEYVALTVGGMVDRLGRYTIRDLIAGTTTAGGFLSAPLPNRPDGTPLFAAPPHVTCSVGDTMNGGADIVAPSAPGSRAALAIRFVAGATGAPSASALRHVNYVVTGAA